MPFRVSGKNINIGDTLRERVNARMKEVMSKYFDGGFSGHVTVSKEKFGFRSECFVHLTSGLTLEAEAIADDAYASTEQVALRIEKRLRRYKGRLKDRHAAREEAHPSQAAASYVIAAPEAEAEEEVTEFSPVIIAESVTTLRALSVSDAVLELDLTGAPVVVFRHGGNGRVNIVYRRGDGNIGWIDPPVPESSSSESSSH